MTLPDEPALFQVLDATWPAVRSFRLGPWRIREGQGGGQRVSAATAVSPVKDDDVRAAEQAMRDLGQDPLFCVRGADTALDMCLERQGYRSHDSVALYAIHTQKLILTPLPMVSAFSIWPPLAIMADIWQDAGIGPARRAVMARSANPKAGILARQNDRPAGTAFVACHDSIAMIHAIEVVPSQRRQGVGTNMLRKAAFWATENGASILSLAVTRANDAANSLYASIGMSVVGYYHYRIK